LPPAPSTAAVDLGIGLATLKRKLKRYRARKDP
jgi:DNA-binding protein Fis